MFNRTVSNQVYNSFFKVFLRLDWIGPIPIINTHTVWVKLYLLSLWKIILVPRLSTRIAVPRVPKLTFYFTGIDMKNMEINAHFAHFVPIPGADCRTFSHIHCQTHTWQLLPRKRLYKKLASFSKLAMLHIHIIMGTYNTRLTTSVLQIFKGAKCCNVAVFRPVTYFLSRSVQERAISQPESWLSDRWWNHVLILW